MVESWGWGGRLELAHKEEIYVQYLFIKIGKFDAFYNIPIKMVGTISSVNGSSVIIQNASLPYSYGKLKQYCAFK